jgi:hypothetical protein
VASPASRLIAVDNYSYRARTGLRTLSTPIVARGRRNESGEAAAIVSAASVADPLATAPRYETPRPRTFRTVVTCHSPPRAVRMPRALSAAVTARRLVTPPALSCSMIGRTFPARASAAFRLALAPLALASAMFGAVAQLGALRFLAGQGEAGPRSASRPSVSLDGEQGLD